MRRNCTFATLCMMVIISCTGRNNGPEVVECSPMTGATTIAYDYILQFLLSNIGDVCCSWLRDSYPDHSVDTTEYCCATLVKKQWFSRRKRRAVTDEPDALATKAEPLNLDFFVTAGRNHQLKGSDLREIAEMMRRHPSTITYFIQMVLEEHFRNSPRDE